MSGEPNEDDNELELTPDMELNPDDESEEQQGDEDNPENNDEDDAEQTVVAFEGEEPETHQPDNSTIRQMRQQLRDKDRELSELRKASAPKPIDVGEKPTLAGCDFDEERYEAELDAFKDRKAAADRQQESQAEQSRAANEAWRQDFTAYEQKKAALQFEDRDDAIEGVMASLPTQWHAPAIIKALVQINADPSLFLYALSKSPAKQAELAKIQDPIKLAAAVAQMQGAVKVTKGRKAPDPDRPLSGSSAMPGGTDKALEKLEKEAERTNDRTKVIAYKKAQAAKK